MFSVYAIYNQKKSKIYIGQSQDIDLRLKLHQRKIFRNSYTSRFDGEWKIIHGEDFQTRKEALIREKQLKSFRGREFVRSLIN